MQGGHAGDGGATKVKSLMLLFQIMFELKPDVKDILEKVYFINASGPYPLSIHQVFDELKIT